MYFVTGIMGTNNDGEHRCNKDFRRDEAVGWRDEEQRFFGYKQYDVYYENKKTIEVCDTEEGTYIRNADSFFDQVIDGKAKDMREFTVGFIIKRQPKQGDKIYFGVTSSYCHPDGKKRHIQMNRGHGEFVALTVCGEFLQKDKLAISVHGNTKFPNHGGYKYFGKYDGYVVKQFVSKSTDFVGHKIGFSIRWENTRFVVGVSDEKSFVKKNATLYEETCMETEILCVGWNAIVLEDYPDQKGYFFISPGEETELVLQKTISETVPLQDKEKYLGQCTDFWSGLPVPLTSVSLPFQNLPDFFYEQKYITSQIFKDKEPFLPFANVVNIVRFLGGWNPEAATPYGSHLGLDRVRDYDLAYRKDNGTIAYRFGKEIPDELNLVRKRLDPFVKAGVPKIRIVLDNIPYCFPNQYYIGDIYGQSALPVDLCEWDCFVRALLQEILRLYGEEQVDWSFRLATEGDDYGRFSGNLREYCKVYEIVSNAITDIMPQATFGPYNVLNDYNHLYEVVRFAERRSLKMDYLSASIYVENEKDPDASLEWVTPNINKLQRCLLNGRKVPFEIHEFDLISLLDGSFQKLPGARGAAAVFHVMMNLREQGVDRIFHWGIFENIQTNKKTYIMPESRFWLLCVLHDTEGSEVYRLPYRIRCANDENVFICAIGFFDKSNKKNKIIVSAYHQDPGQEWTDTLEIVIPFGIVASVPDEEKMKQLQLCNDSDWCYQLRKDLEENHFIVEPWTEKNVILKGYKNKSLLSQLCGDDENGLALFDENYLRYEEVMQKSYQWKASETKMESDGENFCMKMKVENPMVYVVTWE